MIASRPTERGLTGSAFPQCEGWIIILIHQWRLKPLCDSDFRYIAKGEM